MSASILQIVEGEKTVAATGTPERLSATELLVRKLTVVPRSANTGNVFASTAASPQMPANWTLGPGEGVQRINLYDIFVRVTVNGEGVVFLWEA